jgi:DNA-directed RNA polymerase specialized sigma24 family protein
MSHEFSERNWKRVPTDELVQFVLTEPEVLEEIFERYAGVIHKLCHAYLGKGHPDEEALFAEVRWMMIPKVRNKYKPRTGFNFGAWFKQCARTTVIDACRRRRNARLPLLAEDAAAVFLHDEAVVCEFELVELQATFEQLSPNAKRLAEALMSGDALCASAFEDSRAELEEVFKL